MTIPKEDIHAALTRLAEWFPQTFVLEKHLPHRPLKVGIAADILARCPVLTRRELGPVLGIYAKRVMYLQSLVAGAIRIDLDGNPVGEVSAADAEHAAATLAEILASREAGQVLVAASRAARIAKQAAATAAAAPAAAAAAAAAVEPPAVKVVTLKKRPVLRLPAFRQQRATRATDASTREIPPRP
jgi:ProP effector